MKVAVTAPVVDKNASDFPVGTLLTDADGDRFMKVGVNKWAQCDYTRSDSELENYVSSPVTIDDEPQVNN